jgi:hypothetical protein
VQFFGYFLPFSYPTVALRAIAFKDSTIANHDVQMAFLVLVVWIVLKFVLSLVFIRKN